ncbi:hypothetical protein DFQ27_002197 [Actinomortierella ambigua]|uniref:Uncharacterized protein n=1 Tax=Actinomortierella ambigua TaxID=1343610 RepID=A0A9P6QIH7_9FUNG|nr:hypothetical protein DFQ26_004849 [Actinomortierella ambigua]KAG0269781.1 hypothetical protein DFQ27_002197 [Actinomortierella ambigua]
MQKTILLTLALVAEVAFSYSVIVKNNAGDAVELYIPSGRRICACLKNTQSKSLQGVGAGTAKIFWSSTCTGSYNNLASNGFLNNAHWVNSISFGANLGSSEGPAGCPNFHALLAANTFAVDIAKSSPEDAPKEEQLELEQEKQGKQQL